MRCEICDNHEEEVGELLDGVCRSCNPDSHEWADEEEDKELWNN